MSRGRESFTNRLSNAPQRVVINGAGPAWLTVTSGALKGSYSVLCLQVTLTIQRWSVSWLAPGIQPI